MIYLTGDTHGEANRIRYMENQYHWTAGDMLLVCGDFGYLSENDPEKEAFLDSLEKRPYTICFIDGNHEHFPVLNAFPTEEWNGGKIHRVRKNVIHLMRGQVFTLEGKTFFTMGGAYSVDRLYRDDWWMEEIPCPAEYEEARASLARHHNQVDFVLTHTAPRSVILRLMNLRRKYFSLDCPDAELTAFLEELKNKLQFRHWYFGHFHEDLEIDERFTLLFLDVVCLN